MSILDLMIFQWLNTVGGQTVVEAAYFIADYGPMLIIGLWTLYFVICRRSRTSVRQIILLAGLAAVLSLVVVDIIASEIYRPRPFTVLDHSALLIPASRDSSFPSAEATWSAAIAVAMLRVPARSIRFLFAAMALFIGMARPVLGDHWPSDILASFVLGGVMAQAVFALNRPLQPITNPLLQAVEQIENRLPW